MEKLLSFHGDPAIKEKYLSRVRAHAAADEIIQGTGFDRDSNKGCAVGCTLDNYSHPAYEKELGIPMILAIVEDNLFEKLSVDDSKTFPLEFLEAIPVGVDLDLVYPQLFAWQLTDEKYGIINLLQDEKDKEAIQKLSDLYTKYGTGVISEKEFRNADRADRADRAYRAYLGYRAYRAYLGYRADRADRAYRAYLAYLADRADLAYRAYLADLADLADRAYLGYRADRADRAYLGYYPAMRVKLIELLKSA